MSSPPTGDRRCQPTALTLSGETAPENVDPTRTPQFGWRLETTRRDSCQTAYRLVVGDDEHAVANGRGTIWDSGRVESQSATAITYDGPPLASDAVYYWSVTLWTDDGTKTDWATPAQFQTALRPEDWRGDWISHQPGTGDTNGWRSRWQPPAEATEWFQVDLGESQEISSVELYPTDPIDIVTTPDDATLTPSWDNDPLEAFGFPVGYRIAVANDPAFTDATVVVSVVDSEGNATTPADGELPVSIATTTCPQRAGTSE